MRCAGLIAIVLLTGAVITQSRSQLPASDRPQFEEASVRPNESTGPLGGFKPTPGRFAAANMPLRNLILYAYRVFNFQLVGGPDWIDDARYDISAVMAPGFRGDDRPMVQTLLEGRFRLRVQRETRTIPIYALVRLRPDGELGPNLRPVATAAGPGCTMRIQSGLIDAKCTDWTTLSLWNQLGMDRMVVDRTGLTGRFDVKLEWSRELNSSSPTAGNGTTVPVADERVSIFTALQEQLGLRVQPETGPVAVVVIESVERPTPD